jgi:predicted acylesterase/phospholipase RssA
MPVLFTTWVDGGVVQDVGLTAIPDVGLTDVVGVVLTVDAAAGLPGLAVVVDSAPKDRAIKQVSTRKTAIGSTIHFNNLILSPFQKNPCSFKAFAAKPAGWGFGVTFRSIDSN